MAFIRPAAALAALEVSVQLTRQQARSGGQVDLSFPVGHTCPDCNGWSRTGIGVCSLCRGTGVVEAQIPVCFSFPPGIATGDTGQIALDRLGLPGTRLLVHFAVAP
jgi:DnaJ-class molecular chaperone